MLLAILLFPTSQPGEGRLVGRFDFEEATVRPLVMPLAFEQITQRSAGSEFPSFGDMTLTQDRPAQGQFAFRFDLKGRSMAARTRPGAVPVEAMVDHRISLRVRTRDLERAGVRVVGWLEDELGNEIESTRSISPIIRDDRQNQWTPVTLVVPGVDRDAAELALELQLVQPDLQSRDSEFDSRSKPLLEDVSGQADFDDIRIEQWPRLHLADASRIGLHKDDEPTVHIRIDDIPGTNALWELDVVDSDGRIVHEDGGPILPEGIDRTLVLPLSRYDWYQVRARVEEADRSMAQDTLSLAVLPDHGRHHVASRIRLDLTGPESTSDTAAMAVDLLGHLGAGEAIIPAWHPDQKFRNSWPETRDHVDELNRIGIKPVLALNWIPPEHQSLGPFDADDAAGLLATRPDILDETINAAIIAWGDDAARWRVGRLGDADEAQAAARNAVVDRLEGMVVNMMVETPDRRALEENPLEPVRQRMRTSAHELIQAWFDDDGPIVIDAPWRQGTNGMEPTASYAPLHTLIHAMAHRNRTDRVPAQPGIEARLLQGSDRPPAIIVWRTSTSFHEDSVPVIELPEMAGSIRAHDALGNTVNLFPAGDQCRIPVDDLPIVIEGFTPELARMMTSLNVQPTRLAASIRIHDHVLQLKNTMSESMNGHLMMNTIDGVTIRPSIIGLDLAPGEMMERDIEIVVTTPLPDGDMPLEWEARLDSGRRLPMTTWIDVGMPELDVVWSRRSTPGEPDLVIDLHVTNLGTEPRYLDASLSHPELDMLKPTELRIEPAGELVQSFRIPGGTELLKYGHVAMLLSDREGTGRLRNLLPLVGPSRTAVVGDGSTP